MSPLDESPAPSLATVMPSPRRSLRTGVALTASLTLFAASAGARADAPAAPPGPPLAAPPAAPQASAAAPAVAPPLVLLAPPFPPGWPPREAPTRMRSPGLMAGGIVLALAGTAATVGGVWIIASAPHCSGDAWCFQDLDKALGIGIAVPGVLMLGGGLAMAIVGGWQVPVGAPARAAQSAWVPSVTVGPQRATLAWRF